MNSLPRVGYKAFLSPSDRAVIRNEIAKEVAEFERTHTIIKVKGFERVEPLPKRKAFVDPETKLLRGRSRSSVFAYKKKIFSRPIAQRENAYV